MLPSLSLNPTTYTYVLDNMQTILLILVWLIAQCAVQTVAQFGVANKKHTAQKETSSDEFDGLHPREALVQTLLKRGRGKISVEDATNIAFLLETANKDPKTLQMVEKMKREEEQALSALVAETPDEQLIFHLHTALEEIKLLDILFADPARALKEMEKEGMIEPKRIKEYQKNPKLLEEDTRRSLYFSFISMSVAAGFL